VSGGSTTSDNQDPTTVRSNPRVQIIASFQLLTVLTWQSLG
jgi:hypothetical protein